MKAQGLARIGRDVELKQTQSGDAVASISLAFAYGRKGQDGKRPTQWVDAALWGKRAESLAPYLQKGNLVVAYIKDVHVQEYVKRDGTTASKLAATVEDIELVALPKTGDYEAPKPAKPAPKIDTGGSGFDDFVDDDLPF